MAAAEQVLRGCHSYTLVKPSGQEKITVRRGQSIENLEEADKNYLSTKTITPPSVDDSHPAVGRFPLFQQVLPEDIKGEASIESIAPQATPAQPYAGAGPTQAETVTVQVQAAPAAAAPADDADDDGAAAGGADDSGGDPAPAAEAPKPAAAPRRRRKPATPKAE